MWKSSCSLVHLVPLVLARSSALVALSRSWWKSSRTRSISVADVAWLHGSSSGRCAAPSMHVSAGPPGRSVRTLKGRALGTGVLSGTRGGAARSEARTRAARPSGARPLNSA